MFDPSKFSVRPTKTITIGKSDHPVLKHVVGMYLKAIPSKCELYSDLFYLEVNDGKGIVTYHRCDHYPTLQFHDLTLEAFKAVVGNKESFNSQFEVVNVDPLNKWLGNDIFELLSMEEII